MWFNLYVGLPFKEFGRDRKGVDCWGLYRLIHQEQFGLTLPSYDKDYASTEDFKRLGRLIPDSLANGWSKIPEGQETLGDIIIMRLYNVPMHVGFVTRAGWMLHIMEGIDATHEPYNGLAWKDRIIGFYRYDKQH